jgi:hypothetical protein
LSGGAAFLKDGGTWKLAGINYGVGGPYSESADGANALPVRCLIRVDFMPRMVAMDIGHRLRPHADGILSNANLDQWLGLRRSWLRRPADMTVITRR